MDTFPLDVLRAQPPMRHMPGVLLALATDVELRIPIDDVVDGVLRDLVDPPDEDRLVVELMRCGDYQEIEHALGTGGLADAITPAGLDRLRSRVERERTRTIAHVQTRKKACAVRKGRLEAKLLERTLPEKWFKKWMKDATESAHRSAAAADAILDELVAKLAEAEDREIQVLERERLEKYGRADSDDEPERSRAIRRALNARAVDRARHLLRRSENADSDFPGYLAPYRRQIPYREPLEVLYTWVGGVKAVARPAGFERRWGVIRDDPASVALFEALEPFVLPAAQVGDVEFQRLVHAVDLAFAMEATSSSLVPPVYSAGDVRWSHLRSVGSEGLYATDGTSEEGIVVLLPPPVDNRPSPGLERAPSGQGFDEADGIDEDEDVTLQVEVDAVVPAEEYYILLGDAPAPRDADRAIKVGWQELLALVGDPNRRLNMARLIGRQVRPEDAFPDLSEHPARNPLLCGREQLADAMLEGDGPALWIGPPGSGRSSTLGSAEAVARSRGWKVRRLRTSSDVTRLRNELGAITAEGGNLERWLTQAAISRSSLYRSRLIGTW